MLMDMAPLKPTLRARNLGGINKGDGGEGRLGQGGATESVCVGLYFCLFAIVQINDLDPHAALFSSDYLQIVRSWSP